MVGLRLELIDIVFVYQMELSWMFIEHVIAPQKTLELLSTTVMLCVY